MPGGVWSYIPLILDMVNNLRPRPTSILDIGVGFGRFGFLLRQYLEIAGNHYHKEDWEVKIVGVEIFDSYITNVHNYIYDEIIIGDAIEILDSLATFDVVLAVDIIEHFPKEKGLLFLEKVIRLTRSLALILTPKERLSQGETFGNPYERHLSHWQRDDFLKRGFCCVDYDGLLYCDIFKTLNRYQFTPKRFISDASMLVAWFMPEER